MMLASKASLEDNHNFYQAMNSPEAYGWFEAMEKEFNTLVEMEAWDEVPQESAKGRPILQYTWS